MKTIPIIGDSVIVEFGALLFVVISSAVAGVWLAKRFPFMKFPLLIVGFVLLFLILLPNLLPAWFYFLYPGSFAGELLYANVFLLLGVIGVHYRRTGSQRILHDVFVVVLLYFVLAEPLYFALKKDYIKGLDLRVVNGVTIQASNFSCVAASLATILRRWGYNYKEGEVAYPLRTTFQGTRIPGIIKVVAALGAEQRLEAKIVRTDFAELQRLNVPAILFMYWGRKQHANALLGIGIGIGVGGGQVFIGEPLNGLLKMSISAFFQRERLYRWNGKAVIIAPDFLHTIYPGDEGSRAAQLFRGLASLGYAPNYEGIAAFQRQQGLEVLGYIDWKTVLVIDDLTGPPERPRLSTYRYSDK
jgi:predicted double-glycine peptidase